MVANTGILNASVALVTADIGVAVAITVLVVTAIVVPYTVTVSIVEVAVNTVVVAVGKTSVKDADIERGIETDDITDEDKNDVANMEGEDDTEGSEILVDNDVTTINNLIIINMCA